MVSLITKEDTSIPFEGEESPLSFASERLTKVERGRLKGKVTKRVRRVQQLMRRKTTQEDVLQAELVGLIKQFNILASFHGEFVAGKDGAEKAAAEEYMQDVQGEVIPMIKHGEEWLKCARAGRSYVLPSSSDEEEEICDSAVNKLVELNDQRMKGLEEKLSRLESMLETSRITTSTPLKASSEGNRSTPVVVRSLETIQEDEERSGDGDQTAVEQPTVDTGSTSTGNETLQLLSGITDSFKEVLAEVAGAVKKGSKPEHTFQIPKFKLHKFSGEAIDYWPWIKPFDSQVPSQIKDPAILLGTLVYYTTDSVHRALRFCNMRQTPAAAYQRAREILEDEYGKFEDVATAWLDKFHELPAVRTLSALKELNLLLMNCQETLMAVDQVGEFETKANIYSVVAKLPAPIQERWQQWAVSVQVETGKRAKLKDLVAFTKRIYQEKGDPVYGGSLDGSPVDKKHSRPWKKTVMTTEQERREEGSVASGQEQVVQAGQLGASASHEPRKKKTVQCSYCNENHILYRCSKFRDLDVKQRMKVVVERKICINCFHPKHDVTACKSPYRCHKCKSNHHTLLHDECSNVSACNVVPGLASDGSDIGSRGGPETVATAVAVGKVALPIVPVKIWHKGKVVVTYALIDTGSTCTLCTERVMDVLELRYYKQESIINTVSKARDKVECKVASFVISNMAESCMYTINEVMSRNALNISVACRATAFDIKDWPHLQGLDIPDVGVDQIDLLIGLDHPELHKERERREGQRKSDPYAVLTDFGWYVAGPLTKRTGGGDPDGGGDVTCYAQIERDRDLTEKVERFWQTDDIKTCEFDPTLSQNDRKVLKLWDEKTVHDGKNYHIPIPFKKDPFETDDNREQAVDRLNSLGRRLNKDGDLKVGYVKSVRKRIDKGHSKKVAENDKGKKGQVRYLPHHPVIHPRKKDPRSVYDCKTKWKGFSLNDLVHSGPDLMNKLLDVFLGFRRDRYVILGDIEGMFSQIFVLLEQQDAMRWLWWEDDEVGGKIVTYKMCVHIFGGVWSPSCANYTLKRTATDFGGGYDEETVRSVRDRFYVDDGMDATSTEDKCARLGKQVHSLLGKGGFNYTKLNSNSDRVLRELAAEGLVDDLEELLAQEAPFFVLGSRWFRKVDHMGFSGDIPDKPNTRRGVLSTLCSLYDPLGLISPVIMEAKIIFQDCTRQKLGWDDPLTPHLRARWEKWKAEVRELDRVRYERCVLPAGLTLESPGMEHELHLFSDAATPAYGSAAYLRTLQHGRAMGVTLVMSKGKLAPLRQQSIPRLELSGAHMSVHLRKYLEGALGIGIKRVVFWVDSTVVLYYIFNDEARYPPYVGNRLGFISENSVRHEWRHIPTKLNPADLLSRGCSAGELADSYLWRHGPVFLLQDEAEWPVSEVNWEEAEKRAEKCKERVEPMYANCYATAPVTPTEILLEHSGSFRRTKRRLVYFSKFLKWKAKRKFDKRIQLGEMDAAEHGILAYLQRDMLDRADKNTLRQYEKLYPMTVGGLMRVGGRLENADLPMAAQHPIVIPRSQIARAIIYDLHKGLGHAGPVRVLHEAREKYWLIGGLKQVKSVLRSCIPCKKLSAKMEAPLMSALPAERVEGEKPPFHNSGVDYFGPIVVKSGRTERKRYGCLFTCMSTRAIHIELVHSLDTDSCLKAIFRFAARRGWPRRLRSDNGTNFVGGKEELKRLVGELDEKLIAGQLMGKNCEWVFNTPAASHQGGAWERMIRTVRRVLLGLVNEQTLTDESLHTFFCLAEDMINGRPLTGLSDDPRDLRPLTPNDLLRPGTDALLPLGIFKSTDKYRRRWRQVQYLIEVYWKRWTKEYLTSLQVRTKWVKQGRSVKVGDLVLVQRDNMARNVWPMARITETYPDKHGVVRNVRLKTAQGEYSRPVQKICVLEASDGG